VKRAFFSWSGGKDSMLALHRALESGYDVVALLAMFDEKGERSRSHGLSPQLVRAQADALGIPLLVRHASWATYEAEFIAATTELAASGVSYGLFGDIDLEPHRVWEETMASRIQGGHASPYMASVAARTAGARSSKVGVSAVIRTS
jgi:diphthamide synthase (EF-2-diphthine--ammonia ligase)